jgi:Domain of unknown function (DUF4386)
MTTMPIGPITESQRKAARVVGLAYLLAMGPAIFAEFYVIGRLVVSGNAAETARNIAAHERLFRIGTASNLLAFAIDIALITALYVVLERVNRNLALFAVFCRLIETVFLVVAALNDFEVLRLVSGADYLQAFRPEQLQALGRLSLGAHGAAYTVGLLFFGFGSPVFCWLWWKSGYIPKALAAWGVFASLLIGVSAFAFIVSPELRQVLSIFVYAGPIFLFELTTGLWLLIKGIRS